MLVAKSTKRLVSAAAAARQAATSLCFQGLVALVQCFNFTTENWVHISEPQVSLYEQKDHFIHLADIWRT